MKRILHDKFVKDNIVFFIGSMAVSLLNYLYHPILGRMMSVEAFGDVQAFISLTYIIGIALAVFKTIAVNIVSTYGGTEDEHMIRLGQLQRLALVVTGVCVVVIIGGAPYWMRALQISSVSSFIPLALGLVVGVPLTFYNAFLQGERRFGPVSIAGIIASGGKLLLAVLLVMIGWNVFGAVTAIALANFCTLVYVLYILRTRPRIPWVPLVITTALRAELRYGGMVFCAIGFITFFYTADVLIVKHYFDPETAGLYSGIATIARIIFFATASIAGVLLPTITVNNTTAENIRTLLKALIIITILGGSALLIFTIIPKFVISVLIGETYHDVAHLLPITSAYLFLASLVNLFFTYLLAIRHKALVQLSIVGFVCTIGLTIAFHSTVQAVIVNFIGGALVTLCGIGVVFYQIINHCYGCNNNDGS